MKDVARGQIGRVKRMQKCDNAVVGKKLTRYESLVRGCIVIMDQRNASAPQFRSFLPNVLPQTVKNTAVEPGVHGLAFGGKCMCTIPQMSKNTMSMLLVTLRLYLTFFGLEDPGLFQCEDYCLVLGSYP